MEVVEGVSQQERIQIIADKRKWQTEMENKKRQLEDDRRALQHLKSKALRERWLLDGAPSAGPEQDEARRQLEQDEARTRTLEDTINRLEQELIDLETGGSLTVTNTTVTSSVSVKEVKGHGGSPLDRAAASDQLVTVVHEMNGESGVHQLSSSEVDDLIHKADEASLMSQTGAESREAEVAPAPQEAEPRVQITDLEAKPNQEPLSIEPRAHITGLEAGAGVEVDMGEASAENPVTMVFMGYQSVEDEAETEKVLGLQGTVKAELVLITDADNETLENGKTERNETSPGGNETSPGGNKTSPGGNKTSPGDDETSPLGKDEAAQMAAPPPPNGTSSPAQAPAKQEPAGTNGEPEGGAKEGGDKEGGDKEINKEKQPCKCCIIM